MRSWIGIIAAYVTGLIAAIGVGFWLRGQHPLLVIGVADVAATVVVFVWSIILDNSSMYDPYWSVAPVPIALFWLLQADSGGFGTARHIAVFALVCLWAVRLTGNWAYQWRGPAHEDWRYRDFRQSTGMFYWPVSFLGIHLMPTVLVFLGCLALWPALAVGNQPLNWLDGVAALVTLVAIGLEFFADLQMRAFRRQGGNDRVVPPGLWSISRHPNYLGEVLFWWGLYLFGVAADPRYWWTIVGPVAMTVLFLGISIPLMERHLLARHPTYANYQRRVAVFLPWPKR